MSKRGHGGGALTPKHCQDSVTGSISSKRHKTAIEQEIEEAEEYERRKETEQRRAQQLKLLSLDDNKASASTRNASRAASQQHADKRSQARERLMLEQPSKAPRSFERSEEIYNEGEYPSPKTFKANPISKASLNENFPGMSSQLAGYKESRVDGRDSTSRPADDDVHRSCQTLGKLRLPRSLLEKWVEEPFFEKAVIGCFVRLGVGKAPGTHGAPQYKVCEIVSVGKYKHAYAFGEFETTKALMLRIGRNERLWRMNVISNHRFTEIELREWLNLMRAERQKIPSASEIDIRKAKMREAVFGHPASVRSGSQPQNTDQFRSYETFDQKPEFDWHNMSGTVASYSEADVARIVAARRKRSEAARFREHQAETVARLNHGQMRTRYEHAVYSARDTYAALLVSQSKNLVMTPSLNEALQKVEQNETWRTENDSFDRDLDALASRLLETRQVQLAGMADGETKECRKARLMHRDALQNLMDFRRNAFEHRKKRDAEAPSRTSALHSINKAKKHQNALADIAYGEKKYRDELEHESDADHTVFQRRATKPTMLWTTNVANEMSSHSIINEDRQVHQEHLPFDSETAQNNRLVESTPHAPANKASQIPRPSSYTQQPRPRSGMSLREYFTKRNQ